MNTPALQAFRRNALFRNVSERALADASISLEQQSYEADDVIFREGDVPDYCYLVLSGAVRVTKSLAKGQQELLAIIDAGQFFGELALYDSSPRSANATAAVPTQLGRIDQQAFERLRGVAPLEVMSTLADVSIARIRQTNDRLIQELLAAGRLREVGSEFKMLAHNLRTPFATIRMAADSVVYFLDDSNQDREKAYEFVRTIQRVSNSAIEQIEQMMARLRGDSDVERSRISVLELLDDLRVQSQGHLRPGVRYEENATFRGAVIVDRRNWVAALLNLVKNSIDALPETGGDVTITVMEESGEVVFRVADTGCGVAQEKLPRFFEPDFSEKDGGTGVGTAHVRSVAEEHGGRVTVESVLGKGTAVEMRIPVHRIE